MDLTEGKRGYSYDIHNFVPDIRDAARNSNGYVLEIGAGKGDGSTIAIQEGLAGHPTPLHISVDIEDGLIAYRPDVEWWRLIIGDSTHEETVGRVDDAALLWGHAEPGLIFIDTHHTYDHMQAELAIWHKLAGPETVWLFHDTWMFSCYNLMTDAIKDFTKAHPQWVYDDFKTEPHGLGRMRWAASV